MPMTPEMAAKWKEFKERNSTADPYALCIIRVAEAAMELLDTWPGAIKAGDIINAADKKIGAGGITGNMAAYAAQLVMTFHDRGFEFKKAWNVENGMTEEKAAKATGVVNPAVMVISEKPKAGRPRHKKGGRHA